MIGMVGAGMSIPKMSTPKMSTPKSSIPTMSTVPKYLFQLCLLCQNVYFLVFFFILNNLKIVASVMY